MISADEICEYNDIGVAVSASKSISLAFREFQFDPISIIEQAGVVSSILLSEASLRAVLCILEPWVEVSVKDSRFVGALWNLVTPILNSTPSLRPLVLTLWKASARTCSNHSPFIAFLIEKYANRTESMFAIQAFKSVVNYCNRAITLKACWRKIKRDSNKSALP